MGKIVVWVQRPGKLEFERTIGFRCYPDARPFLDLPSEVRNLIYEHAFHDEDIVVQGCLDRHGEPSGRTAFSTAVGLSLASRKIYNETITMLYANTITFTCDLQEIKGFLEGLKPSMLALIKRVNIRNLFGKRSALVNNHQVRLNRMNGVGASASLKRASNKPLISDENVLSWIAANTRIREITALCPSEFDMSKIRAAAKIPNDNRSQPEVERRRIDDLLSRSVNDFAHPELQRIFSIFSYVFLGPSLSLSARPRSLRKISIRLPYLWHPDAEARSRWFGYGPLDRQESETGQLQWESMCRSITRGTIDVKSHACWESRKSHNSRALPDTRVVLGLDFQPDRLYLSVRRALKTEADC
ncbi:MAG: hypothetical protein M1828_001415 [Chrysothrix sp. TS-e1954]|nr:MAG: hypothetical protein M1828_001415 [Chrysothrix sp. TS-e1954]